MRRFTGDGAGDVPVFAMLVLKVAGVEVTDVVVTAALKPPVLTLPVTLPIIAAQVQATRVEVSRLGESPCWCCPRSRCRSFPAPGFRCPRFSARVSLSQFPLPSEDNPMFPSPGLNEPMCGCPSSGCRTRSGRCAGEPDPDIVAADIREACVVTRVHRPKIVLPVFAKPML